MKNVLIVSFLAILLSSCIGDDIIDDMIDPVLRVNNQIDSLAVGSEFQFDIVFFNNVGVQEDTDVEWTSSDPSVIAVSRTGLAVALSPGEVEISVTAQTPDDDITVSFNVVAGTVTAETEVAAVRTGVIRTTTFYDLEGDFELSVNDEGNLILDVAENYVASSSLPGFYLYLTNNPRSIAGGFEVGEVTVFRGAHSYEIEGVGLNEFNYLLYFCRPFNVKVGDGAIE